MVKRDLIRDEARVGSKSRVEPREHKVDSGSTRASAKRRVDEDENAQEKGKKTHSEIDTK